jgi:anti-sigma factor RsiW
MKEHAMSNQTRYSQEDPILMRFISGELDSGEARRLELRLGEDEELRRRWEELRAAWEGLEPPPTPPVPASFARDVTEAARRLSASEVSWSAAPLWARTGAAAALVLGLVLGIGAGRLASPSPIGETVRSEEASDLDAYLASELESVPLSLAEAYGIELEEGGEMLLGDSSGEEEL